MAQDIENTKKKYQAIRTSYIKWTDKKYKGVRVYTDVYIFKKLEERFFLTPKTLEEIVYHRTKY